LNVLKIIVYSERLKLFIFEEKRIFKPFYSLNNIFKVLKMFFTLGKHVKRLF